MDKTSDELKDPNKSELFPWALTAFITLLLGSNVIAGRLVEVKGWVATSAMFLFPLTYVISDWVPEVYGYSTARKMIWFGTFANILMVGIFTFANALPYPEFFRGAVESYNLVLGVVPRIVVFSIIAYWVGSFVNATIMVLMKKWMVTWDPSHRFLALRTILSTIGGEGVDSLIFITGSFLFTMPFKTVVTMVLFQWIVKVGIEIVMTPVTYWFVNMIKRFERKDIVITDETSFNPFTLRQEKEQNLSSN